MCWNGKEVYRMEKLNIFQRISKVMEDVEYLQKDDKVVTNSKSGTGYKAISEEKVTSEVRKSLIKNGIVIIPIEQKHKREDETLTDQYGNEKVNRLTTVDTIYRIQNIEDKEDYVEAVSSGTGVDTQDKGIGKAMTYSYKYLLLRTFAIPTGEDADKISSEMYSEQFSQTKTKKTTTKKEDKKEILIQESQRTLILEKFTADEIKAYLQEVKKPKLGELTIQEASSLLIRKQDVK